MLEEVIRMAESDTTTVGRVTRLVAPILADLHLDLYDLEYRGGTLRITVDAPAGEPEGQRRGLDMEAIALATRLISRELDHEDPVPGHYTLEVSSPGLERSLRTPEHFVRSLGATVAVRLRDIGEGGERRVHGVLEAADESNITVRADDGELRTIPHSHIDRAKTVFVWGPTPKPGAQKKKEPKQ
jgi:ribosome maturation factor RimP